MCRFCSAIGRIAIALRHVAIGLHLLCWCARVRRPAQGLGTDGLTWEEGKKRGGGGGGGGGRAPKASSILASAGPRAAP
eukprot:5080044-Pyramimonas_sp.AAC.1